MYVSLTLLKASWSVKHFEIKPTTTGNTLRKLKLFHLSEMLIDKFVVTYNKNYFDVWWNLCLLCPHSRWLGVSEPASPIIYVHVLLWKPPTYVCIRNPLLTPKFQNQRITHGYSHTITYVICLTTSKPPNISSRFHT